MYADCIEQPASMHPAVTVVPGAYARQGLPTDDLSVQNGILVTRATRFPILVDPQGQGRAWLRQREAAAQLRTIGLADKSFRAVLEVLPRLACITCPDGVPSTVQSQRERHVVPFANWASKTSIVIRVQADA